MGWPIQLLMSPRDAWIEADMNSFAASGGTIDRVHFSSDFGERMDAPGGPKGENAHADAIGMAISMPPR